VLPSAPVENFLMEGLDVVLAVQDAVGLGRGGELPPAHASHRVVQRAQVLRLDLATVRAAETVAVLRQQRQPGVLPAPANIWVPRWRLQKLMTATTINTIATSEPLHSGKPTTAQRPRSWQSHCSISSSSAAKKTAHEGVNVKTVKSCLARDFCVGLLALPQLAAAAAPPL
jgi:hypothetical protein